MLLVLILSIHPSIEIENGYLVAKKKISWKNGKHSSKAHRRL